MSVVLKIEDVSKQYRLGVINHGLLYKDIQSYIARKMGKPDPHLPADRQFSGTQGDRFWALKDINLEIKQGDRVGIIGRNGAGKSTLLKILSRVTSPTTGQIKVKGRIASLLEVGTGFHPELTGRENVYLNGAIMGMSKWEIKRKLDEIVSFAGVEKFIDTPVKRYSSGMHVRLGFSVAAHLEPEILVVDEVLAVGDAEFQKKALGKMEDVSKDEGRTVLFVSHNMSAVKSMCNKAVTLDYGRIVDEGYDVDSIVSKYLDSKLTYNVSKTSKTLSNKKETDYFLPYDMYIVNPVNKKVNGSVSNDKPIRVIIDFEIKKIDDSLVIGVYVRHSDGTIIFVTQNTDKNYEKWPVLKKGLNKICIEIPNNLLNEGKYQLTLFASLYQKFFILKPDEEVISIPLIITGGLSSSPLWTKKRDGYIAPVLDWKVINTD